MLKQPILSIVTPTLGNFSEYWLQQLLSIQGEVEFILVYPPGATAPPIEDPRVKILYSLYKGETPQRAIGLLNVSGEYVIALDDDDFLHPHILNLTKEYFKNFPQSWLLRLYKEKIDYLDQEKITRPWQDLPDINQLNVSKKRGEKDENLLELPIAPLENPLDIKVALWSYAKRKDIHGAHVEPFNNSIWKTQLVKETLIDLTQTMRLAELLTWLPLWGLDRALGLFIQAKFFQKDSHIGHWMPEPGQIRYIVRPYSLKTIRLLVLTEGLLIKRFPQYGYFWNLFFEELYNGIKTKIRRAISPNSK
ncbi:MAG TPA: glycosyl transferase family A [Cyanobacteria bacterium UBA11162]|nr:glycosyl transferase family A [Cyanobacteria bacterium UBA11162]